MTLTKEDGARTLVALDPQDGLSQIKVVKGPTVRPTQRVGPLPHNACSHERVEAVLKGRPGGAVQPSTQFLDAVQGQYLIGRIREAQDHGEDVPGVNPAVARGLGNRVPNVCRLDALEPAGRYVVGDR